MSLKNEFIIWLLDNKLDHIAGSVLLKNTYITYERYIEINNNINFNIRFNLKNNEEFSKVAPDGCEFIFENNRWKIQNINTKQTIELAPYKELDSTNTKDVFDSLTKLLHN